MSKYFFEHPYFNMLADALSRGQEPDYSGENSDRVFNFFMEMYHADVDKEIDFRDALTTRVAQLSGGKYTLERMADPTQSKAGQVLGPAYFFHLHCKGGRTIDFLVGPYADPTVFEK